MSKSAHQTKDVLMMEAAFSDVKKAFREPQADRGALEIIHGGIIARDQEIERLTHNCEQAQGQIDNLNTEFAAKRGHIIKELVTPLLDAVHEAFREAQSTEMIDYFYDIMTTVEQKMKET